jgi:hypothetical protein
LNPPPQKSIRKHVKDFQSDTAEKKRGVSRPRETNKRKEEKTMEAKRNQLSNSERRATAKRVREPEPSVFKRRDWQCRDPLSLIFLLSHKLAAVARISQGSGRSLKASSFGSANGRVGE